MIVEIKNILFNIDNVFVITKGYFNWKSYPYNIEFHNTTGERVLCSFATGDARETVVNQILGAYNRGQKTLVITENDCEISYAKK